MNYIHPINDDDETLIDQGMYVYYRNGERIGVIEPWQRHQKADGSIVTRAERDATVFGNKMLCYTEEVNGKFTVIELRFESTSDTNQFVYAEYLLDGSKAVFNHKTSTSNVSQRIDINGAICLPLMRVFYGKVLEETISRGGQATVLVPWIKDPTNLEKFFTPHFSDRTASVLIDKDTLTIDNAEQNATVYEYIGDQYQAGSKFWVNENQLLCRYCWQQDENLAWDTLLEEYQTT